MRSSLFGLVFGSLLAGSSLMAAPNAPLSSPTQSEAVAMSALLEQVLNSIDKTSLDIQFDDLSVSKAPGSDESKVSMGYGSLSGMVRFNRDWVADLVTASPNEKVDPQISRLYPKLAADAKDLVASIALEMRGDNIDSSIKFFGGYNATTKTWVPRPITLQVSNQMNKSLLSIRLHSLTAQVKANPTNPLQKDVVGTCESDKMLLDMATGKNQLVKVACEFNGSLSDKGYQIHFKYMNRN